jgi:iron complex transport system ATP-binding protein
MTLSIDSLSVHIRNIMILKNITAQFEPGKITVLLGPNGAGKSTLLRTLSALIAPSAGTINLDNQSLHEIPARRRAQKIGLLSQSAETHWDLSVRTVVALGRLPHHGWLGGESPVDQAAITDAMQATDVMQFSDRPVLSLSGGERARVLLARVLAGKPQWLLADEPLAHLDLAHQRDVLGIFKQSAAQGCGVILVLHDLAQAAQIADDIVLLADGQIVARGEPASTLTKEHIEKVYGVAVEITKRSNETMRIELI